jgi:hypothetical protein
MSNIGLGADHLHPGCVPLLFGSTAKTESTQWPLLSKPYTPNDLNTPSKGTQAHHQHTILQATNGQQHPFNIINMVSANFPAHC